MAGDCNVCFSVAPEPGRPQIPGPQVPPRLADPRQDRVLSVSGKKKCSHCKEELGNTSLTSHSHKQKLFTFIFRVERDASPLITSQLDVATCRTVHSTDLLPFQAAELP